MVAGAAGGDWVLGAVKEPSRPSQGATPAEIAREREKTRTLLARYKVTASQLSQQVQLPTLYPLQAQIKEEAARFNVLCIGRRAGKTYLSTHLILETALAGKPAAWFVPDYKVAIEAWRDITAPLKGIATKINGTERRIDLPNGGVIEVWTLENEDAGRGRKYARVVVDEAAMAARLKPAWEGAIRPTLTDLRGDAWFPSTPKGLNFFYHLFQRGIDPLQADWKAWQLPSTVNPFLPAGEVEAARLELPEQVFKQEYLAEFLSSEGAVFRHVDECMTAPASAPGEHADHLMVAGVDWGRAHDFTACSVICCQCACEVALDRFNQIGWEYQRERLLALCAQWGVRYCLAESNSIGGPNLEAINQAAPKGLYFNGFETTGKSKPRLIQGLGLAFEKEAVRWLANDVARMELVAYEATVTDAGHIRYGAPTGQFDDTVIARALAYRNAVRYMPTPLSEVVRIDEQLPAGWQLRNVPGAVGSWAYDGWAMAREHRMGELKRVERMRHPNLDDTFEPASPLAGCADWEFTND